MSEPIESSPAAQPPSRLPEEVCFVKYVGILLLEKQGSEHSATDNSKINPILETIFGFAH